MTSDYAVFLGWDVGKGEHHARALAPDGKRLHDKPLPNTEDSAEGVMERGLLKRSVVLQVKEVTR